MPNRIHNCICVASIVTSIGFLLPKFAVGGLNVGLMDIGCVSLIGLGVMNSTQSFSRSSVLWNGPELVYVFSLAIIGLLHGVAESDLATFAIVARMSVYVLAGIVAFSLPARKAAIAIWWVASLVAAYYTPQVVQTLSRLATGELPVWQLLWDYGGGRLTAPYETGTSSVPLGYAFSIGLVAVGGLLLNARKGAAAAILFAVLFTACLLTASRAAIIGGVITSAIVGLTYSAKHSRVVRFGVVTAFAVVMAAAVGMIISKTVIDGALDSSGGQRLEYYQRAISASHSSAYQFLVGSGISDNILYRRTGIAFYESLFFNSLVQGGVFLAVISFLLTVYLIPSSFRARFSIEQRRLLLCLGASASVGNLIGGANYFSPFCYILFCLTKSMIIRVK